MVVAGQWNNPATRDTIRHLKMLAKRDTLEREIGLMEQGERFETVDGARLLIQVQGAAAFHWSDTLSMDARSLAPRNEILYLGNRRILLTYRGREISRVVQVGDSAPSTTTSTHPHPPFAFNQLDLLIRSVPLKVGYRAILPLYSEVTDVLEMDTLEVQRGPVNGDHIWMLRFSDPAIVSQVGLHEKTREIHSYETTPRTGAGTMRRVSVTSRDAGH